MWRTGRRVLSEVRVWRSGGVAWVTNDTPCKGEAFITRGDGLEWMRTGKLRRLARLR